MYGRLLQDRAEIPQWLYERRKKSSSKSNSRQLTSPFVTSRCSQDQYASTLILSDLRSCCISAATRSDRQFFRVKSNCVGPTKNKIRIRGVFFCCENHTSSSPRLPCRSPRSHHQKTITKNPYFSKPPQNTSKYVKASSRTTTKKNLRLNSYSGDKNSTIPGDVD